MCDAGPRDASVITGHTVLTRAVPNVLPQAGLSCYQGVTSVCALWTTRLGISGEMAPPRGEDARREPLRGGRGATAQTAHTREAPCPWRPLFPWSWRKAATDTAYLPGSPGGGAGLCSPRTHAPRPASYHSARYRK